MCLGLCMWISSPADSGGGWSGDTLQRTTGGTSPFLLSSYSPRNAQGRKCNVSVTQCPPPPGKREPQFTDVHRSPWAQARLFGGECAASPAEKPGIRSLQYLLAITHMPSTVLSPWDTEMRPSLPQAAESGMRKSTNGPKMIIPWANDMTGITRGINGV